MLSRLEISQSDFDELTAFIKKKNTVLTLQGKSLSLKTG